MPDPANLRALFFNATRKHDPTESDTLRHLNASASIMEQAEVNVQHLHLRSHALPAGVQPDMRDQGHQHNDWPKVCQLIQGANILIVGTPIWLGGEYSQCRKLTERLYAMSGKLNDRGQSAFYG